MDIPFKKILVISMKTTSLNPATGDIVQLSILNGRGKVLLNKYVKPWPNMISCDDIAFAGERFVENFNNGIFFMEIQHRVQTLINKAKLIVGYNLDLSLAFLRKQGLVFSPSRCSFLNLSLVISATGDSFKGLSLPQCAAFLSIPSIPKNVTNDSLAAAQTTFLCFRKLFSSP